MRRCWRFLGQACLLLAFSCFPVLGQSSADPKIAVTAALRAGDFGKALELLQPALQRFPVNPQLWTLQALAYSGKQQRTEALTSFRKALKLSPEYLPALEGAAQLEYETGGKDAPVLLQRVLKLVPNNPTAHAMLAALAYKNHNCPEALSHFQRAGSLLDSQPEALREYGVCLAKAKQYENAIAAFQKLISSPGSDQRDRLRLGALQLTAGKPADAIQTLTPLLQDHPDSSVLALAGEAYEEQKDTPQAVKLLHQAIVENPQDVNLYLQFADISFVHQSFQVGVDMIDAGLKLRPKAAALYLARGILYVQLANYDRAEADFEKANELDPYLSASEVARGMVAQQQDDLDKALAVVRARLNKRPNDPMLLYVQADILVQKNPDVDSREFNDAIASARKASQLQPDLVSARDTLAKLYLQAGKDELAVEESRASLRYDPNDQVALYHLIVGLRRTGHKSELPALLQRLSELRQKATREEGEHNRYKLVEQPLPGEARKE
jgi:tetratricopeptide (TPR) repeat protein